MTDAGLYSDSRTEYNNGMLTRQEYLDREWRAAVDAGNVRRLRLLWAIIGREASDAAILGMCKVLDDPRRWTDAMKELTRHPGDDGKQ